MNGFSVLKQFLLFNDNQPDLVLVTSFRLKLQCHTHACMQSPCLRENKDHHLFGLSSAILQVFYFRHDIQDPSLLAEGEEQEEEE